MSDLKQIVDSLKAEAAESWDRAYRILGARPGPGIDLIIYPAEPINGQWWADGLTEAGVRFVDKFWPYQPMSNQKIAELRKQATDWGLKYHVKIPSLSITETEHDTIGASDSSGNSRDEATER